MPQFTVTVRLKNVPDAKPFTVSVSPAESQAAAEAHVAKVSPDLEVIHAATPAVE